MRSSDAAESGYGQVIAAIHSLSTNREPPSAGLRFHQLVGEQMSLLGEIVAALQVSGGDGRL
jgi:hypothetical protein